MQRLVPLSSCLLIFLFMITPAAAQTAPARAPSQSVSPNGNTLGLLAQLEQQSAAINMDLGRLRVDKWKTDSATRQQADANAASIQRNLTAALPTMIQQVRANPQSLAANFKLYRNLGALYDVLSSLSESAGAFGGKSEFEALANDVSALDGLRRNYADSLEAMSQSADSQLTALRAGHAATTGGPKKVVIDDTDTTPKKSSRKKKSSAASAKPQ